MLLQQRAGNKYHSAGLWTNACCSHPLEGEDVAIAAAKRLQEEMGFITTLRKAFTFVYRSAVDNSLTEHEFDHVFIGEYDGTIAPDPREVKDYCYMSMPSIRAAMESHPQKYTSWFKIAFPKLESYLAQNSA